MQPRYACALSFDGIERRPSKLQIFDGDMLTLGRGQCALQVQHGLVFDANKQPPVIDYMPSKPCPSGATNSLPNIERNSGLALRRDDRFTHG